VEQHQRSSQLSQALPASATQVKVPELAGDDPFEPP
jgi:hypothetical protein